MLVSELETNMAIQMNNNEQPISKDEAKSTIEFLGIIDRDTNATIRPPLWLNLIMSCLYGTMTFSWASTRHENLWMLGLIISTILFLLAVAFYVYSNRLLGVKLKLIPKSRSEFKFYILSGLFFGTVFVLTRVFSINDIWWASYIGGFINGIVLTFLLHNYSTGDYMTGGVQND